MKSSFLPIWRCPVAGVPQKVVAEVSRIGHLREVSCCDAWNPLMDRKVVGVVIFGVFAMVAVVTSHVVFAFLCNIIL